MALSLEQVVKQIADSGIIAPGKLENFVPPKAHPKDAEELARQLVKADHLTPFQGQHVKAGKVKALILGNYTVLDKIGAGGMGQVFKAEHRRMHRVVAIKTLPPAMTKNAATLARFEREVTAAAKLSHPNIVAAYDADEANGAHFLVMEYVEGKDLSAHVKKNGRFSVDKAVNYILQAARGLEFAHAEGVIHRDIKPANLLLDKKGVVKILDMGLARIDAPGGDVATQAELTGTGAIMGTVDYMAPEQGVSTHDADARADIYSLGCSLHYLLIGKPVYGGDTVGAKFLAHHHQPIPDLCALREDMLQQVNAIFQKMVAKKVEDRYQTMTAVIADLQACGVGHDQSLTMQRSISSNLDNSALTFLKNIPAFTANKSKPTKKPGSASNGKKKLIYGAVGAGLLGVLILAGIIVSLPTKDGTLIVEVDQPDAMVQVLDEQGKVEISQKGGVGKITIGVDPGKHRLKVEKDGFTVFGENFEMESGDKKAITAKLVPVKHEAVASTQSAGPPKPMVAPFDAKQAHAGQAAWAKHLNTSVEQKNTVGMTLVLIPPGDFLMGSTPEENALGAKMAQDAKLNTDDFAWTRLKEEGPQHRVSITKPYWLGSTEVTVGQFKKFIEATKYVTEAEQFGFGNSSATKLDDKITPEQKKMTWRAPGYTITDDSPVTQVTWNDCVVFCNWMSDQEKLKSCYRQDAKSGWIVLASGTGYRLPTEAEWEYACRAGTTTQFSFGDDPAVLDIYGWLNKNAGGSPRAVGLKVANPFGLFDMHGNAYEWCQDFYAGDYYSKSSPNDPTGPSSGSYRVGRGGYWHVNPVYCRSAFRYSNAPVHRNNYGGFRVLRVADATADARLATGAAAHQPNQPWNTPSFQQWKKDVQAQPAEKQIEAVAKKLVELNPGFDGKVTGAEGKGTPKIDGGVVTELGFITDHVTNISPVQALVGLKALNCSGNYRQSGKLSDLSPVRGMKLTLLTCTATQVRDLSPLEGMALTKFFCGFTQVSDLSSLHGMPLTTLECFSTEVSELSPLQGMPLKVLNCGNTKISDLSPLQGMPLTGLIINDTFISDVSPLQGMDLGMVSLTPTKILKGLDIVRQMKSLKAVGLRGDKTKQPPAEFWKKYDAGEFGKPAAPSKLAYLDPAFQQWVKTTQSLPPEKQVEAVSKKLMELNPGFDGKVTGGDGKDTSMIHNGVVTQLKFFTDNVTDISPLRVFGQLVSLRCSPKFPNRSKLSDLSPLEGMPLIRFECTHTDVSNLSSLRGMPLTVLSCKSTPLADLSPLQGMPLRDFDCPDTQVSDLSPLKGMPLTMLRCYNTHVCDLSLLQGMDLVEISITPKNITKGMEVLRQMKSLNRIEIGWKDSDKFSVAEFWKKYDAGEFGKPATPAKLAYLDPAFQQWVKTVAAMPAEKQVEAVSKKLVELNPGFDGKLTDWDQKRTPTIEQGVVIKMGLITDHVTDISPVRALVGLKVLKCDGSAVGNGRLTNLSPLIGMTLRSLDCNLNRMLADLSPLHGMPLTTLRCYNTQVADLSPLRGMHLTTINLTATPVSELLPLQGMDLKDVAIAHTSVKAISSLKGMSIGTLSCDHTKVSDLSPLEECTRLISLVVKATKVTPTQVAALQKALPNCKIEWDDPAKPKTPEPPASGTK